mgnify:FL=1
MRLILLSDTHGLHDCLSVPDGDILIHAGDITMSGTLSELELFDHFLSQQPHRHKIVIAGNHDSCLESNPREARERIKHGVYLQDAGIEIDGIKFWGTPWQPWFMDMAFNVASNIGRRARWSLIPSDTQVLITHTPPRSILDLTSLGENVGCEELARVVKTLGLRLHVFGHIHEAYGIRAIGETTYINACTSNLQYQPIQPPIVFDL